MKALVTITHGMRKVWDGVRMDLQGDCTELNNLQRELKEIKKEDNAEVNRMGLKLNQVKVNVELKRHKEN